MQQQQGWVHLLEQQLTQQHPDWQIINTSISGETTAGGLARLPSLLVQYKPDTVLIELGGNDGLRGFSINLIRKNLSDIIQLVQQHNATAILMQIRIPPNYGPRYGQQFSDIYPALAKQYKVILWPFFMEHIAVQPELMLSDGIHPNIQAQPIIRDFMMERILEYKLKE